MLAEDAIDPVKVSDSVTVWIVGSVITVEKEYWIEGRGWIEGCTGGLTEDDVKVDVVVGVVDVAGDSAVCVGTNGVARDVGEEKRCVTFADARPAVETVVVSTERVENGRLNGDGDVEESKEGDVVERVNGRGGLWIEVRNTPKGSKNPISNYLKTVAQ